MKKILAQKSIDNNAIPQEPFVFLGGTWNGSNWRDRFISKLTVAYWNPIVANWSADDIQKEHRAKKSASVLLYVLTPKQHGFFTPVEMAVAACESVNKKAVIVIINEDSGESFTKQQINSNSAIISTLIEYPDVEVYGDLDSAAESINKYLKKP